MTKEQKPRYIDVCRPCLVGAMLNAAYCHDNRLLGGGDLHPHKVCDVFRDTDRETYDRFERAAEAAIQLTSHYLCNFDPHVTGAMMEKQNKRVN